MNTTPEAHSEPLRVPLSDLLGRLEAHACMHDDLVMHDAEQAQWAADLRAAKAEIERLREAGEKLVEAYRERFKKPSTFGIRAGAPLYREFVDFNAVLKRKA